MKATLVVISLPGVFNRPWKPWQPTFSLSLWFCIAPLLDYANCTHFDWSHTLFSQQ
uniref:Uncharacterized protein n=1 Tax=Daphnia magna TaxID=35525 RepID=A0A0P4Y0I6_9CRUS